MIVEKNEGALYKVPLNVNRKIHAVEKHKNDSVITYKTETPLSVHTLNKIYISNTMTEDMLQYYMMVILKASIISSDNLLDNV